MLTIIILLNYVAGWIVAFMLNWEDIQKLYSLSQEEPGPENSAKIRAAVGSVFELWFIIVLVSGFVGLISSLLFLYSMDGFAAFRNFLHNWAELARRYKKAKRGYGIKPEPKWLNEMVETETPLHTESPAKRSSDEHI